MVCLVTAFVCGVSVFAFLYFEAAIAFFERMNVSWFEGRVSTGQGFRTYAVALVTGTLAGSYLATPLGARILEAADGKEDRNAIFAGFLVSTLIFTIALFVAGDATFSAFDYYGWPFFAVLGFGVLVGWLKLILIGSFVPGSVPRWPPCGSP